MKADRKKGSKVGAPAPAKSAGKAKVTRTIAKVDSPKARTSKKAPAKPVPAKAKAAKSKTATVPKALAAKAQAALPTKPPASLKTRETRKKTGKGSVPRQAFEVPPVLLEGDLPPTPPMSGPGTRYALTPETFISQIASSGGELPESYGTNHLFLAARDPRWLLASWDLTSIQQREFNARSRDGHLILRVFANDENAPAAPEQHVHPESRSWFVNVPRAETRYHAELGFYESAGRWISVAISKSTFTPPDQPSTEVAADFTTIPAEVTFQQIVEIVQEFASENEPLMEAVIKANAAAVEPPAERPPAAPSAKVQTKKDRPARPAALAVQPSRSYRVEIPIRIERQEGWTQAQAQAVASLVSIDEHRRVWMGSLEITELIRRQLREEIASMAVADLARGPAEGRIPAGLGAPSSALGGAPTVGGRDFWFKVNAELIVYGATEPDATVTIADRPIKLRPDGSFSFRFSLPDGRYQLPAIAISRDGEDGREARLEFSRSTNYQGHVEPHPQNPALRPPRRENVS
jgi:hypothetical protein